MPIESLVPLIHQLAASAPDQAIAVLRDYSIGKLGDLTTSTLWRGVARIFYPGYKSERQVQREDIQTLKQVVDAMSARLDVLDLAESQPIGDRATDAFVTGALESALESTSDTKHVLLGQLIAQRLFTETESSDDLFLRESLGIVRRTNQVQLFALGALYLVRHPPESFMPPDGLRAWWDGEYMPLLIRFSGSGWSRDDMDYLERLGAVERDRSVDTPSLRMESRHGPVIDNVLARRSLPPTNSHSPKRSEFEVYCSRLHDGTAKTTPWPAPELPLFPYALTVPGGRVARMLVDSLSSTTIEESARSTTYPFDLRQET